MILEYHNPDTRNARVLAVGILLFALLDRQAHLAAVFAGEKGVDSMHFAS